MDNLINYKQKINKRQRRPKINKKSGLRNAKKEFSLFSFISNMFKNNGRQRIRTRAYKPMAYRERQSVNRNFKNSLKGQYLILPQQIISHVSHLFKREKKLSQPKIGFLRYIKPILIKFSIVNVFLIVVGLTFFLSSSIYSSAVIPADLISLPQDSNIDYLIESMLASKEENSQEPFGDIDLSLLKGFSIKNHIVAKGESLSVIAKKYNVDTGTLISFNNIKNARLITAGSAIKVPDADGLFYKVAKGDSLSSIAEKHKVSLNNILDINNLSSHVITPGQELFIPGAKMESFALKKALGELFIYPTAGRLTSPFGMRNDPFTGRKMMHSGIDLANASGTPVRATLDGKVIMCGFSSVYGNYIIIKHRDTYQSLYAHLNKFRVKEGEQVTQNQIIGDMGNTGRSTGPHLHFSIYHNQKPIDPLSVLSK